MSKKDVNGRFLKKETPRATRKLKRAMMKTPTGEWIEPEKEELPEKKKSGINKLANRKTAKRFDPEKAKREEKAIQRLFVTEYLQKRKLEKEKEMERIQTAYILRDIRKEERKKRIA